MAKTKRKHLAALAALQVTSPKSLKEPIKEYRDEQPLISNEEMHRERSPSLEYRPQRIIIWIPSSNPPSRLVNSRKFSKSGALARKRKRKRSNDHGDEESSSDAEVGRVYKKYAKIIFKLDNWSLEKEMEKPGPSTDAPPPLKPAKAYRRRKSVNGVLPQEGVLSVLMVNNGLSGDPSVRADKLATAVENNRHISANGGENVNRFAPSDSIAKEPLSRFSRRLSQRLRKISSHKGWVAADEVPERLRHEQEDSASRKKVFNPTRKVVIASEKEVDIFPEKVQENGISVSTRQKTKSLKETLPHSELAPVTCGRAAEPDSNQRRLRSAERKQSNPESSEAGVRVTAQVSEGRELKKTSKLASRNLAVPVNPETAEPADDGLKMGSCSNSPRYSNRKGAMEGIKTVNSMSKVKIQKTSVISSEKKDMSHLRSRRRAPAQPGKSAPTLETQSVANLALLNTLENIVRAENFAAVNVQNSESSAAVPLQDQPRNIHPRPDVHTRSCKVAVNAGSKRTSFLGKETETAGEELETANPGLKLQREASCMKAVTPTWRNSSDGNHQTKAKFGWSTNSTHNRGGASGDAKLNMQEGIFRSRASLRGCSPTTPNGGTRLLPTSFRGRSGPSSVNPADLAAIVRAKLEEVGGLTEWLVEGGLEYL